MARIERQDMSRSNGMVDTAAYLVLISPSVSVQSWWLVCSDKTWSRGCIEYVLCRTKQHHKTKMRKSSLGVRVESEREARVRVYLRLRSSLPGGSSVQSCKGDG